MDALKKSYNEYNAATIKLREAKQAFLQAMVDECYAHAIYFANMLKTELDIGEQWDYNGKNGLMKVYRVITPVIPITPKSPAVHLTPEILVEVIDKNGKIKQIDRPITSFIKHVDIENINPEKYEF